MASTYTAAGIELITQGEQAGAWGDTTNTNWELVEEMVGGVVSVALSTTSETLTTSDGASSDGRHAVIVFTGSPGGTCTVTVSPNDMQKVYFVVNNSDQTVTLSQGSGANVNVSASKTKVVYCDGAGAGAAVVDISGGFDSTTLAELGVTASAAELNIMDGVTATTAELNILDGVTATAAELNILDGVTATTAELNILDGATLDVTELNYVDGVTSAIQTQLDAKQAAATAVTTSTSFGGDVSGTYDAIVVADDSHNHVISNVDGLQTALDAKAALAGATFTGAVIGTDLTLSGDLTVNGTTTTVNTTNTVVSDALIELGTGTTGTPANDAGLVIERGDSANAFIGFDESADKFIVGTGSFTGASTGNLTIATGTLVANLEGNVTGDVTGNASTATAWATGRTISLTGDVTGTSGTFDGSGNLSFATTIAANSVALGTDTTGNYVATGATSGNGISGSVSSEGGTFTVTSNATNANTASTIVYRDASGNFSAGTITANLTGNVTGNVTGNTSGSSGSCTGNAATATAWATGRTLTLSGDVSGTSSTIDGTGNITLTATVADDSHNHTIANVDGLQTALDGKLATGADKRGSITYIGQDTNDYFFVNTTTHNWYLDGVLDMQLTNAGTLHCDGDVIAYSTTTSSDEKLKDNIRVVEDSIGKLKQLRGVEFEWKKDGATSAGVIAQDVEKVLPQAVKTVEDLNTQEPYKTVNYDALHALLIEAVKELSARVEELEAKVG